MVIWAEGTVCGRDLGKRLYLDSGTLTPVLKHLEADGYITRRRCPTDARVLLVTITASGLALRDRAADIPGKLGQRVKLDADEAATLYRLLYKLLETEK